MSTSDVCMGLCHTAPAGVNKLTEEQVCESWKGCGSAGCKKKTCLMAAALQIETVSSPDETTANQTDQRREVKTPELQFSRRNNQF